MASESTSSQQSQKLPPSSKVKFRCKEGIIAFNNVVALLEHPNELYRPMLKVEEETKPSPSYLHGGINPCPLLKRSSYLPLAYPFVRTFNDLTLVKPHTITAASFQKPLASEVPLTSHMLKVAKLSEEPEQSLIPPSRKVNDDDTADKSLSRASVQPVTQPNAPTDLKIKKKRIPPSSKPKSPYKVRVIIPKKQVAQTQHAEVTVATTDATKSLVASEVGEEQVNQSTVAEAEKILDQNVEEEVKDVGFVAMEEIRIIKSYQAATISGSLFIHQSSSYNQDDQDEIDITPKDAEEGDTFEYLSGLYVWLRDIRIY
ncbi:hypothetical protein Tco_0788375 [Tanacetum coccineum]